MSYKKLILKSTATIENAISHYSHINKSLAQKLEKEIRYSFLKISKYTEGFQFRYKKIRII
jgi:hypothetical protein